jgi:hypothetical protein
VLDPADLFQLIPCSVSVRLLMHCQTTQRVNSLLGNENDPGAQRAKEEAESQLTQTNLATSSVPISTPPASIPGYKESLASTNTLPINFPCKGSATALTAASSKGKDPNRTDTTVRARLVYSSAEANKIFENPDDGDLGSAW